MRSPCISIRQPWAAMIVLGIKDVENRTWRFPDRLSGARVLIHAGLTPDPAISLSHQYYDAKAGRPDAYRTGGIIGSVVLEGHTYRNGSRWAFPGHVHWLLAEPRILPFSPCKGRLGFFEVEYPMEAVEQAERPETS